MRYPNLARGFCFEFLGMGPAADSIYLGKTRSVGMMTSAQTARIIQIAVGVLLLGVVASAQAQEPTFGPELITTHSVATTVMAWSGNTLLRLNRSRSRFCVSSSWGSIGAWSVQRWIVPPAAAS